MPAIRSPSLKVRTPAFQAGNAGFKSRGDHHTARIVVVRQTVDLLTGVRFPLVTLWMGVPSGEGSGL